MAAQLDPRVSELTESFRRDPLRTARRVVDHEQHLQHELALALLKIEKLEEEKRLARAERFGTSSEQHPQYALFDEAERSAEPEPVEASADTVVVPEHQRTLPRRTPLPTDLPRQCRTGATSQPRLASDAGRFRLPAPSPGWRDQRFSRNLDPTE